MYIERQDAIQVKYIGTGTRAALNVAANRLYVTVTGTPADSIDFSYDDYPTMSQMVAALNALTGKYVAQLASTTYETPISNEQHVVPGGPTYEVALAQIPKAGTLYIPSFVEVTVTPNQGQFKCAYSTGVLTFNSADTGAIFAATYTGLAPADLSNLSCKYLEIKNNKSIDIKGTSFVDITYHRKITTVQDIKDMMVGIDLSLYGNSITDEWIERQMQIAIEHIQNKTRLYLSEWVIKCQDSPYFSNIEPGVTCDMTEPAYDGTDTNYLKLRYEPLISVERIELVYLGNLVRSYPFEWFAINPKRSEVRIVPKTGSFHLMGQYSGSYLFHSFFPRATSMFGHFLPWIQCDYTAGYKFGTAPEDLKYAVQLVVAMAILKVADGLINPGLASKSIDGVSESYTRGQKSLFGYRIEEYQNEVKEILRPYMRARMVVV